ALPPLASPRHYFGQRRGVLVDRESALEDYCRALWACGMVVSIGVCHHLGSASILVILHRIAAPGRHERHRSELFGAGFCHPDCRRCSGRNRSPDSDDWHRDRARRHRFGSIACSHWNGGTGSRAHRVTCTPYCRGPREHEETTDLIAILTLSAESLCVLCGNSAFSAVDFNQFLTYQDVG